MAGAGSSRLAEGGFLSPVPPFARGEDYLASGVPKENIFRIGDDWSRIDRNEDKFLGRKDKRGE